MPAVIDRNRHALTAGSKARGRGACLLYGMAAPLAGGWFGAGAAHAIDQTSGGVAPGEGTKGAHWSPDGQVPDGTATFAAAGTTAVTNAGGSVTIGMVQFDPSAVSFTFTIVTSFTVNGNGIANDSAVAQAFVNNSTLTLSNFAFSFGTDVTNNGTMTIRDSAQFITGTITNSGGGSVLQFQDGASAVSATINNNAAATVNFNDGANASNATITNSAGATVNFNNSSTAASATIANDGLVNFKDGSNAGPAAITNNIAGTISFLNSSNGGGAIITNSGTVTFADTSSAGGAFITNQGLLAFSGSA